MSGLAAEQVEPPTSMTRHSSSDVGAVRVDRRTTQRQGSLRLLQVLQGIRSVLFHVLADCFEELCELSRLNAGHDDSEG